MEFFQAYSVPVPKVLDYATTVNNAVGSEYIIREKVRGQDLGGI